MTWLKDPKVQLTDKSLIHYINTSSCDKCFLDIISSRLCNHQKNEESSSVKTQNRTNGVDKTLKKFDIDAILKDNFYKDNLKKLVHMSIGFLERMSDEEPKSIDYSSEESTKRSNQMDGNDSLPKRPRMNLWEHQNKAQMSTIKEDNTGFAGAEESDSDKSSSDFESDDETSLEELAASICCLPHSELCAEELEMYPWLSNQTENFKNIYLYVRNKACMSWLKDPKVQLTDKSLIHSINTSSCDKFFLDIISSRLCNHQKNEESSSVKTQNRTNGVDKTLKKFDIDAILKDNFYKDNLNKLVHMAIGFLERHGYVNIGQFNKQNESITNGSLCGSGGLPLQVTVIGAGLSGIIAALQLQYFGCKVLVLEAKESPGGRLQTFQQEGWQAEISPFSITGINNPVNQLIKQAGLGVSVMNSDVDIVNTTGDPVSKEAFSRIECELNRLLLAANDICSKFALNTLDKKHVSLGEMLEALLSLQTLHCKNLKKSSNALILKLMNRLQEVINEMEQHKIAVSNAYKKWNDAEEEVKKMKKDSAGSKNDGDAKDELKDINNEANSSSPIVVSTDFRGDTSNEEEDTTDRVEPKRTTIINPAQQMKVNLALSEYRRTFKKCIPFFDEAIKIRKMIKLIQDYDPASMLLDQQDMQLMDWFFANLEMRMGTHLNNLSLRHGGCHDSNVDTSGSEIYIKKGFQALMSTLTKKSTIFQYNTVVKEIEYSNEGIMITAINTALSEEDPVFFKADVVVSTLPLGVLKESINNPLGTNAPQFSPPLPDWKIKSINALGFGMFDKVVLCFKERFWGHSNMKIFAQLKAQREQRGEFMQFYAFSKKDSSRDGSEEDSDESSGGEESKQVDATVVGVVCGKAATNYTLDKDLTDVEMGKRALAALRDIFLKRKINVPEPSLIYVYRWTKDPYARGVFSYIPEGASLADVENVAIPLPVQELDTSNQRQRRSGGTVQVAVPKLFFAGEHTHSASIGTIQGAMMSGLKAASDICKHYFPQLPNILSRLPGSLQIRK